MANRPRGRFPSSAGSERTPKNRTSMNRAAKNRASPASCVPQFGTSRGVPQLQSAGAATNASLPAHATEHERAESDASCAGKPDNRSRFASVGSPEAGLARTGKKRRRSALKQKAFRANPTGFDESPDRGSKNGQRRQVELKLSRILIFPSPVSSTLTQVFTTRGSGKPAVPVFSSLAEDRRTFAQPLYAPGR